MSPPTDSPRSSVLAALLAALVVHGWDAPAGLGAQVVLHRDPFASSGGQSFKNVVRAGDGTLYCVSVLETDEGAREVIVQASGDGGAAWERKPFVFNDDATGRVDPDKTNACAVAIDDRGTLHVTWGNYYYPSSYRQLYRNWNPVTEAASEVFDISAWTGAARTARTAAMDIAVDGNNTVWLVAHGPNSWIERLAYSPAPYAEGLEFVDCGAISPTASSQTTRIAIDAAGRVHCAFYRNIGAGQYEHRIFDPGSGWGESTNLGNTAAPNDQWGVLASDALGNVHVLLGEDTADASTLWRFRYRRWDPTGGWSEPEDFLQVEQALRTGIANTSIVSLACDESTGKLAILHRDLNRGGALGVVEKPLGGAFGEFVEVAPPSLRPHAYYSPSVRGRLYPASDRTSHGLHLTWQDRSAEDSPPYSLIFATLGAAAPPSFRRGDADADGEMNISDAIFGLASLFLEGSFPDCLDAADSNDDGVFNLSDAVYSLNALFLGGEMPPAPGAESCGIDPTDDELGCETYEGC